MTRLVHLGNPDAIRLLESHCRRNKLSEGEFVESLILEHVPENTQPDARNLDSIMADARSATERALAATNQLKTARGDQGGKNK